MDREPGQATESLTQLEQLTLAQLLAAIQGMPGSVGENRTETRKMPEITEDLQSCIPMRRVLKSMLLKDHHKGHDNYCEVL